MDGVKIFCLNTTMNEMKSKNSKSTNLIKNVQNLNDVFDLMIEKQLRIRTAVEEIQFLINNQSKLS